MTKMVCGIGICNLPTNGDNTVGQSFDSTLISFGITDPDVRSKLYDDVKMASEKTLTAVLNYESVLSVEERGCPGGQSDLIGIDFILADSPTGGDDCDSSVATPLASLTPVAIEVNSLNCTTNCDLYEFMYRETIGEALETFIEHAIVSSQRHQLAGRTVVVCGGDVKLVSKAAQDYKLTIVHLLPAVDGEVFHGRQLHSSISKFYHQVHYKPLCDEDFDDVAAEQLACFLRHQFPASDLVVHGCLALDARQVLMASHLGVRLGLPDRALTNISGVKLAVDIQAVQQLLATRTAAIPHWPPSFLYSLLHDHAGAVPCPEPLLQLLGINGSTSDSKKCRDSCHGETSFLGDLLPFVKQIHRIVIAVRRRKLLGAFVFDYRSAAMTFKSTLSSNVRACNGNADVSCFGKFIENHVDHCSDEVLCNGYSRCVVENSKNLDQSNGHTITSNPQAGFDPQAGFGDDDRCTENGTSSGDMQDMGNGHLFKEFHWPTLLPDDKRDELIIASYQCVNELDLVSGLFTLDMTFNAVSPKLIRILPCLDLSSGEVLSSPDGADLLMYSLLIACNLQPVLPVKASFQNHLRSRRRNFGHHSFDQTRLAELIRSGQT
jgi:hypothetical protein